jgi:hypothetical protein
MTIKKIMIVGLLSIMAVSLTGCANKSKEVVISSKEVAIKEEKNVKTDKADVVLDGFVVGESIATEGSTFLLVKNNSDCTVYRSYFKATAKDDSNNVLSVSEEGLYKIGSPLNTIFMIQPGESYILEAEFNSLDKKKLSKIDLHVEADCRPANEVNNKSVSVESYNLKKSESGWSVLGEIKNSDSVERSINLSAIITDEQGNLVNAGTEALDNPIPAGSTFPFEIDLATNKEGNIKVIAIPTTSGNDTRDNASKLQGD